MSSKTYLKNLFFYTFFLLPSLVTATDFSSYNTNHWRQAGVNTDPGKKGLYSVQSKEYNLGDQAFSPIDFPIDVEVKGSIHYPIESYAFNRPVIVLMHGRHGTCKLTNNKEIIAWPCTAEQAEIPSFRGYNYLAEHLASWGFVVVSVSANGISARDNMVEDGGANARAQLIQHHLDLWNDWNTNTNTDGPFGNQFVGKLDLSNIGTMGHSRGGEGVMLHAVLNNDDNESNYVVKAVLPIGSSNTSNVSLRSAALGVIVPYCDGDLGGLPSVKMYDNSLYGDEESDYFKYQFLMMGANHNYYNTVWAFDGNDIDDWYSKHFYPNPAFADDPDTYNPDPFDDPQCGVFHSNNKRYSGATQRAATVAYASAFFRASMLGGTNFSRNQSFLTGAVNPPASSTLNKNDIHISFHAPDSQRLDVNRVSNQDNRFTNDLNERVDIDGGIFNRVCGDSVNTPFCIFGVTPFQHPHNPVYFNNNNVLMKGNKLASAADVGLAQLGLSWDQGGVAYTEELGNRDVSSYDVLQLRMGVNFLPDIAPPNFNIVLTDIHGKKSQPVVVDNPEAIYFPPGDSAVSNNYLPKVILNTVRVSLNKFTEIDLKAIKSMSLIADGESSRISISDVAFSKTDAKPFVFKRRGWLSY